MIRKDGLEILILIWHTKDKKDRKKTADNLPKKLVQIDARI